MNKNEPQYKTMLKHHLLCFNDECALQMSDYIGWRHEVDEYNYRKTVSYFSL